MDWYKYPHKTILWREISKLPILADQGVKDVLINCTLEQYKSLDKDKLKPYTIMGHKTGMGGTTIICFLRE